MALGFIPRSWGYCQNTPSRWGTPIFDLCFESGRGLTDWTFFTSERSVCKLHGGLCSRTEQTLVQKSEK